MTDPISPSRSNDDWREGDAPKDGRMYEMKRSVPAANGEPYSVWIFDGWWDGTRYVRHNQMHGGPEWLMFPTHWRECGPLPSETKEWIPVGERLPPPNPLNDSNSVRVLMYSPDTSRPEYRTEVGCLWYAQNVWMADRARHVTHWMPIPKEPK